jgi:hypothetical protein
MAANVVGLRRVPAKVNLNLNKKTGAWSDPNVRYGYWSGANPVVSRPLQVCFK